MASGTGISGTGISGTGISGTGISDMGISGTGISDMGISGMGTSGTGISGTDTAMGSGRAIDMATTRIGASGDDELTARNRGLPTGRVVSGMLIGLVTVAVSACATGPRLHVDSMDEPIECHRIAWYEIADQPASIAEQRVRSEAMRILQTKGYMEVSEAPDCLVSGVIYTGVRPSSPASVGIGAGRFGGRFGGSVGVHVPVGGSTRTVGNLAIDVVDVGLNAEIWRGTLEAAFRTPEPASKEINAAVQDILANFPDRSE